MIERWLKKFDSISIPLTVIFPAGKPDAPIILRDIYTQGTLLEELQHAVGESTGTGTQANRANTELK